MVDLTKTEDAGHMSSTKNNDLEERIKVLEEDLHILKEKLDYLLSQHKPTLSPPELASYPQIPDSTDKDDWYSNHGQGD